MEIVEQLRQEEAKLEHQLKSIREAIAAFTGAKTILSTGSSRMTVTNGKRTMSAAVRAKIARSARARWAKIKAEKTKKK